MNSVVPRVAASDVDGLFRKHRTRVILAITLGYGFLYTCRLALSVVKKPLIDEGIFSVGELGLIGAALFYGYAAGKFVNGFLSDHVNPKAFFAIGILLSALVNLSMGWSTIVWISVALWALNGWFQGFGAPSSVVSLTNWFSNHERGRYYGIWSASHSIGEGLTFYVIAGIVTFWGWRAGFWSAGAFCVLVAAWVYWFLQGKPQTLGLPSVAEWKGDFWEEPTDENKQQSTWRTQLSIFGIPAIWVLALASALMYVTRYAINSWGIFYLQEEHGYTLLDAGLFMTINTVAGIVGAVAFGFVSDKFFNADRPPANLLFAIAEVASLCVIFYGPADKLTLALAFAVYGAGLSGLLASLGGLFAVDIAPGRVAGAALGFIGIFSYVGAALQEQISAALIDAGTVIVDGAPQYDFGPATTFWVGSSIVSMTLAASLWRVKRRD